MEFTFLRSRRSGLVSQLPLLHKLREGDFLQWRVAASSSSRRVETQACALPRYSPGRRDRREAAHEMDQTGCRNSRLGQQGGVMRKVRLLLAVLLTMPALSTAQTDPKLTEVWEPVPKLVTPGSGTAPPSDAIVLFAGKDLSQWEQADGSPARWSVANNAFTVVKGTGNLRTKRAFGDCQLHVEWRAPAKVEGESQERGNSGVFLQGRYEVQILDSYNNRTYSNGQAASIYKQYIPLVNASRKPGEWQTYDIYFRAPHFAGDGTLTQPCLLYTSPS